MPAETGAPAGAARRDRPPRRITAPALRRWSAPRWRPTLPWRPGLRLRYAITATLLAAATFAVGGTVALTLYRDSLIESVDRSVLGAAMEVAAGAQREPPLPDPIPMPVAASVPRIQVLSRAGKVISGDPASASAPPMLSLASGTGQGVVTVAHPAGLPDRRAAVVVIHVMSPPGPVTIVAAGSLDPADDKASQAVGLSAVLGAVSLAVAGAVAWLTAGRTLRRVDGLRAQVSAITASGDLARRVPQTGGDELARLGSTLNEMLAALSRSAERQRRFVADAAHELRTPLAGLSASLDVAISHPGTAERGSWAAELRDGHRRLGRLINDLLVLASLDGGAPRRRRAVDLAGVVTDCTRRAAPAGIELRAGQIEHAVVSGDESQLARVVTNLVDNALRYARRAVDVTLTAQAGQAIIAVADDGPGIPPADRGHIWGRFARLDDDRSRASGGTGLGLALARELTEAHGGCISLTDPTAGSGALFLVRLPLRADPR